ncbi:MAG TPA: hypothetical protein VK615_07430, partial [Candidatus Binatia bacterium]|nr:hypothetical protein [Candidatus Binatia bacterium]
KPPPVQFNFSSPAPAPAATAAPYCELDLWGIVSEDDAKPTAAKPPNCLIAFGARDPPFSGRAHAVRDQRERRGSDSGNA